MVGPGTTVSNASPLIALATIGQLEIPRTLFGTVLVPSAVWSELTAKERPDVEALVRAREDGWLVVRDSEDATDLPPSLGAGEVAAINLARDLKPSLLLMDEALGRKVTQVVGCRILGTLGLLALAKQKGLVDEVSPLIARLQAASFRISPSLVNTLLRSLGEEAGNQES